MSIEIEIPPEYQKYTDNNPSVTVSGSTVGECLEDLSAKYPTLRPAILGINDDLHPYLDVCVNECSVYPDQIEKPVRDGDRLKIITALYDM